MNYYNDFDKNACAWLIELIEAGHLPPGHVDNRSITDIKANELKGYTQCHFFAGIGGWSLALQLAGWPTDRPVWTGSCPCQPFSVAGAGGGTEDERHLWPAFAELIRDGGAPTVFGEQVASKSGREWLAGVFLDLDFLGYSVAAANLPACSVGAPHRRERLFWVADAAGGQRQQRLRTQGDGLSGPANHGAGLADAEREGSQGQPRHGNRGSQPGRINEGPTRPVAEGGASFWNSAHSIACRDGKARRIEPSIPPLAHGIPGRVALLRGAGNAIVPQVAAECIRAVL